MRNLYLTMALLLLPNLGAGICRILRGPTPADRMLAAQLLSTTALAVRVLREQADGNAARRDVAVVFALLGAMTAVAFVRRAWLDQEVDHDPRVTACPPHC